MMTHAYDSLYLSRVSRAIGNMLHDAVIEYGIDGKDFLQQFIQSKVAEEIEDGNPKYIAGKSGLELFFEVMEKNKDIKYNFILIESYERSDVYWAGWILTHYQWYSGHTFKDIINAIQYDEFLKLYNTLHEADVHKSYEVFDAYFESCESKLKNIRRKCGLTQEELANKAAVSLNTIRAYERRSKDLNKASFEIVMRLAKTLKCNVAELFD